MGRKKHRVHKKKPEKAVKIHKENKIVDDTEIEFDTSNIYNEVEAFHNDDEELLFGLDKHVQKKQRRVEDVLDIGGYSSSDSSDEDEKEFQSNTTKFDDNDDTNSKLYIANLSNKTKDGEVTESCMQEVKKYQKKMKDKILQSKANDLKQSNEKLNEDYDSSDDEADKFGVKSSYFKTISEQIKIRSEQRNKLITFWEENKANGNTNTHVLEYIDTYLSMLRLYLINMNFYISYVQSGHQAEGHPILRDIVKAKYHLEDLETINIELPVELGDWRENFIVEYHKRRLERSDVSNKIMNPTSEKVIKETI